MALTKVFDDCLFALGVEHTERESERHAVDGKSQREGDVVNVKEATVHT